MTAYLGARDAANPLTEPARIAFAGDWHMNASWAPGAIEYAALAGADVIVHLGDFGYVFSDDFVEEVDGALSRNGIPLLFVDGNHDDHDLIGRLPLRDNGLRQVAGHIWHIPRGFRWTWAGVRFLGLGGAHSVDRRGRIPGFSWWPGESLTEADVARVVAGGPTDVLVAHDCPAGVDIPTLDKTASLFPRAEIRAAELHRQLVRDVADQTRPRFIWHGHYHRRYETVSRLGYGKVKVIGLDRDKTSLDRNVHVVSMSALHPDA